MGRLAGGEIMPQALIDYLGYAVYFWISEENEPIHVHVSKHPQKNATKFWITGDSAELAKDTGSVEKKDMGKILRYLKKNRDRIIRMWMKRFQHGEVKR